MHGAVPLRSGSSPFSLRCRLQPLCHFAADVIAKALFGRSLRAVIEMRGAPQSRAWRAPVQAARGGERAASLGRREYPPAEAPPTGRPPVERGRTVGE